MKQKGFFLVFALSIVLGGFNPVVANEPPGKVLEAGLFSAASQKQIVKANTLIEKGNKIWKEAEALRTSIELFKAEFRFGKANKLEKKRDRLLLEAAGYYRDGHQKQYRVLADLLEQSLEEGDSDEAREALMNGKGLFKKARRVRLKAGNSIGESNQVQMLYESVDLENQALSKMQEVLGAPVKAPREELMAEAVAPDSVGIPQISVPEEKVVPVEQIQEAKPESQQGVGVSLPVTVPPVPEPAAAAAATAAAVVTTAPVVAPEVVPEPIVVTEPEKPMAVFFSVQILADRKEVSSAAIDQVYSGSHPVIHVEGDGWHRYMVGRFSSVAEARKAMTDESLKGFIVAYNGEKRITVQEAVELLK